MSVSLEHGLRVIIKVIPPVDAFAQLGKRRQAALYNNRPWMLLYHEFDPLEFDAYEINAYEIDSFEMYS